MMSTPPAGWTDAHCHLNEFAAEGRLQEVLARANVFAIRRFLVNGTRPEDWDAVARLHLHNPAVVPQFGLHPWFAERDDNWETQLKEMLLRVPGAGVGEIGLDKKLTDTPWEAQVDAFHRQLDLARTLQRPCTVHAAGPVWDELIDGVRAHPPRALLLHAWGGGDRDLAAWIELNAWFSFGGALLRQPPSEKLRKTVLAVPLDRILLETDAPWQHPKGKAHRQEPAGLLSVAEAVARIKGVPLDTLRQVTEKNLARCFGNPVLDG